MSSVTSAAPSSRHCAAIQTSLSGIGVPLRIPYGKKLTLVGTLTVAAAVAAIACDMYVYGYKGKLLAV